MDDKLGRNDEVVQLVLEEGTVASWVRAELVRRVNSESYGKARLRHASKSTWPEEERTG